MGLQGYRDLLIFSILSSLTGIFVKLVFGMSAYSILFYRAFFGVSLIFVFLAITRKISELRLRYYRDTFLVGILQGISILFLFLALQISDVSNVYFLLYLAPIFSLAFSKIFLKEKIHKNTYFGVGIAIIGTSVILGIDSISIGSENMLGNVFAISASIFFALMLIPSKRLSEKVSSDYIVFWQYLIIAIFSLPFAFVGFDAFAANIIPLMSIGVLCTGLAFIFFMQGVKRVKAQKVFIVTSLEPFFASLFAYHFLHETIAWQTVIGGLSVLSGIYVVVKVNHDSSQRNEAKDIKDMSLKD